MQGSNATSYDYIIADIDTHLKKVLEDLSDAPETGGYHDLCQHELQCITLLVSQIPDTEDGDEDVCSLMVHLRRAFVKFAKMVSSLFANMKLLCPKAKLERRKWDLELQGYYDGLILSAWFNKWEKYAKLIDWICAAVKRIGPVLVSILVSEAHRVFKRRVYEKISPSIISIIAKHFEKEREKPSLQIEMRLPIKYAIYTFIELDGVSYQEDIEENLLGFCESFFEEQALEWAKKDTCIDYLHKVERSINAELDLVSFFLPPSSEPRFIKMLKTLFLEQSPENWLYREDNGCVSVFKNNNEQDLATLGRLTEGVPGAILDIAKLFQEFIHTRGLEFLREAESCADYWMFPVQLGALHAEYGGHCSKYFNNHRFIYKEYDHAFKRLCNKDIGGVRFSEILVRYFDNILKQHKTTELTNEAASKLYEVLDLSQFILDQQLFLNSYERRFDDRLIMEISNLDNERLLVKRLGQLFGHAQKFKMLDKIDDIETCNGFLDMGNVVEGMGLTHKFLNSDLWENLHPSDFTPPANSYMLDCRATIHKFSKESQKSSHVLYKEGTVLLNTTMFANKAVELTVRPLQAIILLLFNEDETLAYSKIKDLLKIDDALLTSLLSSMSSGECKILRKEPADKPILETDYFFINRNFTPTGNSIEVPRFIEPTPASTMEVSISFSEDKCNSAIVRAIKKHQALTCQELYHSCLKDPDKDFRVNSILLMSRVEDMVKEKYLEVKDGKFTFAP